MHFLGRSLCSLGRMPCLLIPCMVAGRAQGGRWPLQMGAFGPCGPAVGRRQSRGALVLHSRPILSFILSLTAAHHPRTRGSWALCRVRRRAAGRLSCAFPLFSGPYRAPVLLFPSFPSAVAAPSLHAAPAAPAAMAPAAMRPPSRGTCAVVPACQIRQPAAHKKWLLRAIPGILPQNCCYG